MHTLEIAWVVGFGIPFGLYMTVSVASPSPLLGVMLIVLLQMAGMDAAEQMPSEQLPEVMLKYIKGLMVGGGICLFHHAGIFCLRDTRIGRRSFCIGLCMMLSAGILELLPRVL